MANIDPACTYRLSDFINLKDNDEFTYDKYALYMQSYNGEHIIYSSDNSIYTYLDEMKDRSVIYTFSDEEFRKYQYRPKLLAYDLDGSTELYFIILALNDTCNIKDFNKRKVRLMFRQDLSDILSQIFNAESNRLYLNRQTIRFDL